MIGNDIVDLNLAKVESNWQRPRYLSKLFTQKELKLISSFRDQPGIIWRLWTMKEAAYKAHQRQFNLAPKFNPKAFQCSIVSEKKGKVTVGTNTYISETKSALGYIYSEAIFSSEEITSTSGIRAGISKENVKEEFLKYISEIGKDKFQELRLQKCKNRIPHIFSEEKQLFIPFSFTHHGKYSAFVLSEPMSLFAGYFES